MRDEGVGAVFTYGTLQVQELMAAVCGERPDDRPATLRGYARFRVRGAVYPGILPTHDEGRVDGRLYTGVSPLALELLDRFEGELYERVTLPVSLADGSRSAAHVYVVPARLRDRLTEEPWELEPFASKHASRYIAQCRALRDVAVQDATRALAARRLRG